MFTSRRSCRQGGGCCNENSYTPHDVYLNDKDLLQTLLLNEDCFLPSKTRTISELCKNSKLNIESEAIRNGQDRAHRIYETNEQNFAYSASKNEQISYSFEPSQIESVHIVFDSDINRDTLPGGHCERIHSTRANHLLESPQMCMPKTLCKEFKLIGELDGEQFEIAHVKNNRKRAYHFNIGKKFDKLTLIPIDIWSDAEKIAVVSFDFN